MTRSHLLRMMIRKIYRMSMSRLTMLLYSRNNKR
ncbi:hypothetical protein CIPAW_12G057400 [Carya illinoinensis]|uniref:Uncharacterized protein n=1 Tax=Carya illinoinensis TaxID=32201 RepID=A0A8T1NTW9_CARIL|nr:hypothetical protein CIPAW_12G057400 [Carya illinoinensis]